MYGCVSDIAIIIAIIIDWYSSKEILTTKQDKSLEFHWFVMKNTSIGMEKLRRFLSQ